MSAPKLVASMSINIRRPKPIALRKHRPRNEFRTNNAHGRRFHSATKRPAASNQSTTRGSSTRTHKNRTQRRAVQGGRRVGAASRGVRVCERVSRPSAALMHARPPTQARVIRVRGTRMQRGARHTARPGVQAMVRAATKWFDDALRPP